MNPHQAHVSSFKAVALGAILVGLRLLYLIAKFFPSRGTVAILSRQGDNPSLDVKLLVEELETRGIPTQILTKGVPAGLFGKLLYVVHVLRQISLVSRSDLLILDSYSIVASALRHKKNLRIVQRWHGAGAFKKFGHSAVGSINGPNPTLARFFRLHANYDYVLCSGPEAISPFSEAFNVDPSRVLVCPLPHFDLLKEPYKSRISNEIYLQHPELQAKDVILWAPTKILLGRTDRISIGKIERAGKRAGYFVLESQAEGHNNSNKKTLNSNSKFSTIEWMTVSSGVVTDQSSVIFEAMFIGIPFVILIGRGQRDLFFESTYLKREDWNSFIAEDASEAFRKISSPSYLVECLNLKNRYIQNSITGSYTQDIVMHLEKFRSKGTK